MMVTVTPEDQWNAFLISLPSWDRHTVFHSGRELEWHDSVVVHGVWSFDDVRNAIAEAQGRAVQTTAQS
jgi:hypothetical protein